MSVTGWVAQLSPDASVADRERAARELMELARALSYTLMTRSGRPLIWDKHRDDDVAVVLLKLCNRAAQGKGCGETDGQAINYIKAMLANHANDRGAHALVRGEEVSVDDPDAGAERIGLEPPPELMEGLPRDLRELVRASAADAEPERRVVEDTLAPAVELARASRRVDHRTHFDLAWAETLELNFGNVDSTELLRRVGSYDLDTPGGLKAARDARAQRHRSCRKNIAAAAEALREDGTWGAERLELALACLESLKNPSAGSTTPVQSPGLHPGGTTTDE